MAPAAFGGSGAKFFWRKGMAANANGAYGLQEIVQAATFALTPVAFAAGSGFIPVDTSVNVPGPSVAITAIAGGGVTPVVTCASAAGLISGVSIVRIYNMLGATQLSGIDFTVGAVGGTFTLANMTNIVATALAGSYRIIPYNPIYYPSTRYITNISQAAQAVVMLSVTHNYVVGQKIRLHVPAVTATTYGMTEIDGREATIVAVGTADALGSTNTITIDIDTTGFTAFAFPLTGAAGFTPAHVVPVGENTSAALFAGTDILSDAVLNTATSGLVLMGGANGPAGINGHVISWVAGKSFNQ